MLTYDITRRQTFENLETWLAEVMASSEPEVLIILVGNMKDR